MREIYKALTYLGVQKVTCMHGAVLVLRAVLMHRGKT